MLRYFTKSLFILFLLVGFSFTLMAQQTQSPAVDSVVVTFNSVPTQYHVVKAPLKYNKAFAMSFQEDDALSDIYKLIYPVFQGTNGNPGLYYTDGCGNKINFKMSSAIFIFGADGSDILNPDDPYHDNSKLTWPELKTLYKNHWGIDNHGLFDNPDVSSPAIINYAFQRTKSYTRRKISDSISVKSFVIPNNVVTYVNYLKQNHYHSAINQGQDNTWIGYGKNGFNVESDTINWLKPVKIFRDFSYSGFKIMADTLYQASLRGEHRWYLSGMHQMPGSFLTDMASIYQTYGAPGLDDILITNDDDLLDYFAVKQATQLHETLKGNRLVITFSGAVPTDLLHYNMTLNVTANEKIQNIQIYGVKHSSYKGIGADTALINFSWDGRVYQTTEYLADSFSSLAVQTNSQYNALVAMDYVLQMPKGDKEMQLRKELCSMVQTGWSTGYDAGFCNILDLGKDTTLCSGNTISFKGPTGMQSYQWFAGNSLFSKSDSVTVQPKVSTHYFLTVKDSQGQTETDSVWVYVSPTPSVDLGNDTILFSEDTLTFSAPLGMQYSYLWNTGDTNSSLTLDTKWDSIYNISVNVTNPEGCSGQDSVQVTLPPKDSVPEISVLQDTVLSCNGDTVVLKVSSNTDSLTWSWADNKVNTSVDSLKLVPTQSQMVYVKACNSYGCSPKDSIYVLFDVPPDLQHSFDTSICLGDSITLYATGGKYIQWSILYRGVVSTEDTLKLKPDGTVSYDLKTWNQKGCYTSGQVTVTVRPLPDTKIIYDTNRVCKGSVISMTASGADSYRWFPKDTVASLLAVAVNDTMNIRLTGTGVQGCTASDSVELYPLTLPKTKIGYETNKVCLGKSVTLTASGADSYNWSLDNDTSQILPVTVNDTVKINLTGTNEDGCVVSDSVELYPLPLPETKILFDTNYVCQGSTITLTATGADTYQWLPDNKTDQILPVMVNDTAKIDLIGTSQLGCSAKDSVRLYPLPLPKTKIIYDAGQVCSGTQVTLKASGAESYRWYPENTTDSVLSFDLKQSTMVYLIGYSKDGCSSQDGLELTPLPTPSADFSGLLPFYCMNELPVTLQGSPAGGVFSGAGVQGDVFTPNDAGKGFHDIVYTYTNDQGCTATSTQRTLISGPVPAIHLSPADTALKEGGSVVYDAGPGFTHYYWTTGDTTQKIQVNYSRTLPETDTIKVAGLIDNCVSVGSAVLRFSSITGIPENRIKMTSVFPNPNGGRFYINYDSQGKTFVIKIYDFSGKVVFEKLHQPTNPDGRIRFNLPGLQPGIYFVSLYFGSKVTVAKMIIR